MGSFCQWALLTTQIFALDTLSPCPSVVLTATKAGNVAGYEPTLVGKIVLVIVLQGYVCVHEIHNAGISYSRLAIASWQTTRNVW